MTISLRRCSISCSTRARKGSWRVCTLSVWRATHIISDSAFIQFCKNEEENGSCPQPNLKEFKKLRQLLQRKRHFNMEFCVGLNVLRLSHVSHVVQNRRSAFRLAWRKWFSRKGKNESFTVAGSRCRQNLKNENFTSSFGRLRQNLHQSNHSFVAVSLPLLSSFLKLPLISTVVRLVTALNFPTYVKCKKSFCVLLCAQKTGVSVHVSFLSFSL